MNNIATISKGGRSGMAGMAFAIPLFLFVCIAIPLLAITLYKYNIISMPSATPRLTFQYYNSIGY